MVTCNASDIDIVEFKRRRPELSDAALNTN